MIKSKTKNDRVELEELDLSDLSSVRDFAIRMKKKLDRLDILINNAGK